MSESEIVSPIPYNQSLIDFTKKNIAKITISLKKKIKELDSIKADADKLKTAKDELKTAKEKLETAKEELETAKKKLKKVELDSQNYINSLSFLTSADIKTFKDRIKRAKNFESFKNWFKKQNYYPKDIDFYRKNIEKLINIDIDKENNNVSDANKRVSDANKRVSEANERVSEANEPFIKRQQLTDDIERIEKHLQAAKDQAAKQAARDNPMCTYHQYIF